ncbi:MAG: hypothetical protein ACTSU5_11075 [Promethearchaeota archaeon]
MNLETDTMTPTERALAVLNHEVPDRVPIYLMGMPAYGGFFQEFLEREEDPELGFEEFTREPNNLKITPFGDQTIPYFFGQEFLNVRADIEGRFTKWVDADGNFVDHWDPRTQGTGRQVTYYGRLEGVKVLPNGHLYTWYLGGWLDTREKVLAWFDEHGWPHEHRVSRLDLARVRETRAKFGRDFALTFSIGGAGIYEKGWFMMGQAHFFYYSRKDPEFLLRVIDSLKQMQLNLVDELKRARPEIFWCSDDMGAGRGWWLRGWSGPRLPQRQGGQRRRHAGRHS